MPGDADFYVEVRNLTEIRASFQSLGIWETLREIIEGDEATSQPLRQSQQLLGMTSEQLIDRVLGHRAALFARRSDDWQNGVLIAEIKSRVALRALIDRWRGRPIGGEGPVRRYQLPGNLRCAVLDRIVILGPPGDPDGLWARSVLLLTGRGPHLAGQSAFASLRSRFDASSDAIIFSRWPDDYPFAFADCERLMMSMRFEGSQTSCHLYGRRRHSLVGKATISSDLLDSVLPSSIACWAGSLDEKSAAVSHEPLTPSGPGEILHQMLGKLPIWGGHENSLIQSIDQCALIQIGSTDSNAIQFPSLTLTLTSRDSTGLVERLDVVFTFVSQLIAHFSRSDGEAFDVPVVERVDASASAVRRVDLGRLIAKRDGLSILRPMELAWGVSGSRIIVGTDSGTVVKVLSEPLARAEVARQRQSAAAIRGLYDLDKESIAEFGVLRGRAVADVFDSWITYANKTQPFVMSDAWWQLWIAGKLADASRLGIGLVDDKSAPGRAIVKEIDAFSPAVSYLQLGDVIVGVSGKPLSRTHAARSVARRYEARGNKREMSFEVMRGNQRIVLDIPVPHTAELRALDFKPVTALKRLSALLKGIDRAAYVRVADDPAHLDVRIDVHWSEMKNRRESSAE